MNVHPLNERIIRFNGAAKTLSDIFDRHVATLNFGLQEQIFHAINGAELPRVAPEPAERVNKVRRIDLCAGRLLHALYT
ncbi:MAG: hypothetical protein WA197_23100, partial [Candidatus Acidiferrales bacterium]